MSAFARCGSCASGRDGRGGPPLLGSHGDVLARCSGTLLMHSPVSLQASCQLGPPRRESFGPPCDADHSIHMSCRRFFDPSVFRIVLFDQRGCGSSRPSACLIDNNSDALVQDMDELRAQLGIDTWLLLGGSWGVALALAYSIQHPTRCAPMFVTSICAVVVTRQIGLNLHQARSGHCGMRVSQELQRHFMLADEPSHPPGGGAPEPRSTCSSHILLPTVPASGIHGQ